jgi:tetratricopeptide (TPR) repeat protein
VLDIPSLERKWLKYKIKSYLPHSMAILLGAITLVVITLFLNSTNQTSVDNNQTVLHEKVPLKPNSIKNPSNEVTLEPSMQFMQTLSPVAIESTISTTQPKPPLSKVALPQKTPPPTAASKSVVLIAPPSPTSVTSAPIVNTKKPNIRLSSNAIDIGEIEERFKNNPSPQLGLYLARYYYELKDYNEAYNYALKTNSINKDVEESWLIFSKSLIKLGRVEQAKKTLQYYISQSQSENAKDLLNSIEQGSLK